MKALHPRRRRRPAWWTTADAAELEVLIWTLVERIPEHEARCSRCRSAKATGFPCPAVTEAIEAVLAWRRSRALLSRAEWLRARQAAA